MIDCHAHLNEVGDPAGVIQRARQAGLTGIVAVGMEVPSNQATLELARRYPDFVHPALGYHPWSITPEGVEANLGFIREHLQECVALGEVGLDYQAKAKKKLQQEVFARLLDLAAEADLPVIVHTRFSQARAHRMLREADIGKAVFHWYSGPLEVLEQILADGYLISATPALAYSPPHQAAMAAAPLDRILLETDTPVTYQDLVSEPAHLLITLKELSRVKNLDSEEVAAVTTATARRFFGM